MPNIWRGWQPTRRSRSACGSIGCRKVGSWGPRNSKRRWWTIIAQERTAWVSSARRHPVQRLLRITHRLGMGEAVFIAVAIRRVADGHPAVDVRRLRKPSWEHPLMRKPSRCLTTLHPFVRPFDRRSTNESLADPVWVLVSRQPESAQRVLPAVSPEDSPPSSETEVGKFGWPEFFSENNRGFLR